ncbi:cytochrome P450 [Saccharopolyspora sp. NPDC050642]|uniref:cytochrome P450 n=1 Tax=Saccharopolyspora sp. NPDC050642 TaxID=3157099 RepID=UPI0033CA2DF0
MTSTRTSTARPPGPKGRLLVGNTLDYDRDRMAFLRRCHQEYGDVFSFDDRTIVVLAPDLVHDMLARTNEDFHSESTPIATRIDPERAATDAQVWMTARRKGWHGLSRAVSHAHSARLHPLFQRTLDETGGRQVEVLHVMEQFAGRATADFCLGADSGGVPEVLTENVKAIEPLGGSSQLFPAWWPSKRIRRFLKARESTLVVITEKIRKRQASSPARPEQPQDLLDVLLAARDPELSELQVQRLLRGIMLAAYGVPASALTWLVRVLATEPELRRRVSEEAESWPHEEAPPLSALPQTEAVIKEVLRLWPPTWLIGRTARRETALGEWRLRPNDQVMFSPYLIHRDPRWWSDPDRLVPDRWLDAQASPHRHTYIPFGAGPRVCVGTQLGMIQMALAAFWLVREYEVTTEDGSCPPRFQELLQPQGFTARFTPRRAGSGSS